MTEVSVGTSLGGQKTILGRSGGGGLDDGSARAKHWVLLMCSQMTVVSMKLVSM